LEPEAVHPVAFSVMVVVSAPEPVVVRGGAKARPPVTEPQVTLPVAATAAVPLPPVEELQPAASTEVAATTPAAAAFQRCAVDTAVPFRRQVPVVRRRARP
jgi:hypothetical protein